MDNGKRIDRITATEILERRKMPIPSTAAIEKNKQETRARICRGILNRLKMFYGGRQGQRQEQSR